MAAGHTVIAAENGWDPVQRCEMSGAVSTHSEYEAATLKHAAISISCFHHREAWLLPMPAAMTVMASGRLQCADVLHYGSIQPLHIPRNSTSACMQFHLTLYCTKQLVPSSKIDENVYSCSA